MKLPRTSEISKLVGDFSGMPKDVRIRAYRQGRRIHKFLEDHVNGNNIIDYIEDESVENGINNVLAFVKERKIKCCHKNTISEHGFIYTEEGYTGTIDLLVNNKDSIDLIDIKTAATIPKKEPYLSHQLQLTGYTLYVRNLYKKPVRSYIAYIGKTENNLKTYCVEITQDLTDLFLLLKSALALIIKTKGEKNEKNT